jgi:hypothetical protein
MTGERRAETPRRSARRQSHGRSVRHGSEREPQRISERRSERTKNSADEAGYRAATRDQTRDLTRVRPICPICAATGQRTQREPNASNANLNGAQGGAGGAREAGAGPGKVVVTHVLEHARLGRNLGPKLGPNLGPGAWTLAQNWDLPWFVSFAGSSDVRPQAYEPQLSNRRPAVQIFSTYVRSRAGKRVVQALLRYSVICRQPPTTLTPPGPASRGLPPGRQCRSTSTASAR